MSACHAYLDTYCDKSSISFGRQVYEGEAKDPSIMGCLMAFFNVHLSAAESWFKTSCVLIKMFIRTAQNIEVILVFEQYFQVLLEFVFNNSDFYLNSSVKRMIQSLCKLLLELKRRQKVIV